MAEARRRRVPTAEVEEIEEVEQDEIYDNEDEVEEPKVTRKSKAAPVEVEDDEDDKEDEVEEPKVTRKSKAAPVEVEDDEEDVAEDKDEAEDEEELYTDPDDDFSGEEGDEYNFVASLQKRIYANSGIQVNKTEAQRVFAGVCEALFEGTWNDGKAKIKGIGTLELVAKPATSGKSKLGMSEADAKKYPDGKPWNKPAYWTINFKLDNHAKDALSERAEAWGYTAEDFLSNEE